jgi:hypothetical protein
LKKFDQNSFSLTVRKSNYTLPLSGFKISKNRLPFMKKKSLLTLKNTLRYATGFAHFEKIPNDLMGWAPTKITKPINKQYTVWVLSFSNLRIQPIIGEMYKVSFRVIGEGRFGAKMVKKKHNLFSK